MNLFRRKPSLPIWLPEPDGFPPQPPDPFGLVRVYTATDGKAAHTANDPRPLRSFASGINETALHGYLCFSHVPDPLTMWNGVQVAPSTWFPVPGSWGGEADRPAFLRRLLQNAVLTRLASVPEGSEVGVFLSGGLDSSLVAALLVEAGAKVRAFTLDFGPPFDTELPFAQAVAAHLRVPLHTVSARSGDIARALEATAHALPQPFGDAVTVPLYLLGQAAKPYADHVFNGEGGDQVFGGWANKPLMASLLYGDSSPEAERHEYMATYHRFWGMFDRLYTPQQQAHVGNVDAGQWIAPALDREMHPELLHRLRFANLRLKGAQNIAPRMMALAQVHGLQLYAPFFDSDLASWTFTLPPELLLSGSCEKFLLKQMATQYLPNAVVWRTKRGMGVPARAWLASGPVRRVANRYLSPQCVKTEGRFNPAFVRALLQGHDPTPEGAFRSRRAGEKAWALLIWEVWRTVHGF